MEKKGSSQQAIGIWKEEVQLMAGHWHMERKGAAYGRPFRSGVSLPI